MKSLRIYLRKSDMAGNYLGGQPDDANKCPLYRWFERNVGKTHEVHIAGTNVRLVDKVTGGSKRFPIVNASLFTKKALADGPRPGTKVRILGFELPV